MSAFYAVAYSDRIEILTDGISYKEDGTIAAIRNKIWTSDKLPLAFAGRGPSASIDIIGLALGTISRVVQSFDETIILFKERIENLAATADTSVHIDGVVTGISETLGPVIYYFHTYPHPMDGCEPWTFYDVGTEMLGAPRPTPQESKASGIPMYWACDGLKEFGGEYFDLLRTQSAWKSDEAYEDQYWAVGGHVDHTIVRAEGISTERILEWPDKVGEKVDPENSDPLFPSPFETGAQFLDTALDTIIAISKASEEERAALPDEMRPLIEKADHIAAKLSEVHIGQI